MKPDKHFSDEWIGPSVQTFSVHDLVQGSDLIIKFRTRIDRYVLTENGWVEVDDGVIKEQWHRYLKKEVGIDRPT